MAATSTRAIRPNSRPQERFLASPADIAVYGGAAGGGKSWAMLIEPLRHAHNPDFGAVIFRRTSPQVTNEGGLWDEAGKIYPLLGALARVGELEYAFPTGARVTFRHLQYEANKYHWQGAQVPLIGFDELTHFSESQFWYLASRNRSTCGVKPYMRGTCNADAGSWVKRLCGPWVDRKHPLYPTPSGDILWLVRKDGKYLWHRTKEEAAEAHPGTMPKSVTFVRATVFDNVDLLRINPEYLGNLQAQSSVEQARLLHGDWDVVNEGLVYPDFGSCVVEAEDWPKAIAGERVGGIDWGWNNPFAALLGTLDRDDVLWIDWERYASRTTLTDHSNAMPRGEIRWWGDPAGADQVAEMRHAGHDVVPSVHIGTNPLISGVAAVASRIRSGRLRVKGTLGRTIDEAGKYRYDPDKMGEKPIDADNHALAALRYMIVAIDRGRIAGEPPAPSETDLEAIAKEAAAERERLSAEWHDIDNDAFWGG